MPESGNASNLQGFSTPGLLSFNKIFHDMVNDGRLASVVTLISRHGQIVNLDAYGTLDVSRKPPPPVKKDTIYRIASMTKPIIGTAMMMLWQEGKWDLEDPVSQFIPEFAGLKVKRPDGSVMEQVKPMTMKHLMSHTAGFGDHADYAKVRLRSGDLQQMIITLSKLPLLFQPGSEWKYGPSVDIQGYVIEKFSGQRLDEFLESRIFGPLNMKDTGFWIQQASFHRVARIHKVDETHKLCPNSASNTFPKARPKFLAGGGGLLSTIEDFWRFCQMLLNNGEFEGRRYLEPTTVKMMHTSVLDPHINITLHSSQARGLGFGLGFATVEDPVAAHTNQHVGSYYWGGLYGTWFWIDPGNDLIVIGFIQQFEGRTIDGAPTARELSAKAVYMALVDDA